MTEDPRSGGPGQPPEPPIAELIAMREAGLDPHAEHAGRDDPDGPWRQHELLLRLGGRLGEATRDVAKRWAGTGLAVDGFRAVARELWERQVVLPLSELMTLARYLSAADVGRYVSAIPVQDDDAPVAAPRCRFRPFPPAADRPVGAASDWGVDLTSVAAGAAEPPDALDPLDVLDPLDAAMVELASRLGLTTGLWRAWRTWPDPGDAPTPDDARPLRVYLVTLRAGGPDPAGVLNAMPDYHRRFRDDLLDVLDETADDEYDPGPYAIEVLPDATSPSLYLEAAWAHGALLWSPYPDHPVRVATGPDRERAPLADSAERELLAGYLASGRQVWAYPRGGEDAGYVVVATDGAWVWTSDLAQALERDRLCPPADLLTHLRRVTATRGTAGAVTGPDAHRALRAYLAWHLTQPDLEVADVG